MAYVIVIQLKRSFRLESLPYPNRLQEPIRLRSRCCWISLSVRRDNPVSSPQFPNVCDLGGKAEVVGILVFDGDE